MIIISLDLFNYKDFFEKILTKTCKIFVKEMVSVVEFRHIFGMVIDDDGKPVGVQEELDIFDRVHKNI